MLGLAVGFDPWEIRGWEKEVERWRSESPDGMGKELASETSSRPCSAIHSKQSLCQQSSAGQTRLPDRADVMITSTVPLTCGLGAGPRRANLPR